jgi:DNA-binding NarL/FixJ family response regulator
LFLDISMPMASGVEIIHDVRRWNPHTRILVFTGITSPGLIASAVEAGVDALFAKGSPTRDIIDTLPLILRGGRHIAPELVELIERGRQAATLTDRERQILNMVVTGKTNKEMAQLLFISPKTVDKHRTSLMNKLDVHSVAQLMARALKDGLIDPT